MRVGPDSEPSAQNAALGPDSEDPATHADRSLCHNRPLSPPPARRGQCYRKGGAGACQSVQERGATVIESRAHHPKDTPAAGGDVNVSRKRPALIVGLVILLLFGALWMFQRGPTPERWLTALTASLSEQWGAEVSIRAVSLAGFDRIALHDVHIAADGPVTSERMVAAFSVGQLLRRPGEPLAALRWVRAEHWHVTLPADALPTDRLPASLSEQSAIAEWLAATGIGIGIGVSPRMERSVGPTDGASDGPAADRLSVDRLAELLDPLLNYPWIGGKLDVYLQDGRITLGDVSPSVVVDGTITLGDQRLGVRNVRVEAGKWHGVVNGSVLPGPDLYAQAALPHGGGTRLDSELWIAGSWERPDAWGTVRIQNMSWPVAMIADAADDAYALDEGVIQWGYRPGEPLHMIVDGLKDSARLRMQGEIRSGGQLNFVVNATDVQIPEHVPLLQYDDVRGMIDLSGGLMGTLGNPLLEAEIVADGGYLFGQPISEGQGNVRLTTSELVFDNVRVTQGNADYFLDGKLGLTESVPFDLVLRTDRGRAERLLQVLGWDVPVQADLAGTIRFSRPNGRVAAAGSVTLERGRAWGQTFDHVDGDFRYGSGAFHVEDVTASVRGGMVTVSGGNLVDTPEAAPGIAGDWLLHVGATDVPLQAVGVWREQLPQVSGLLDFEGTVAHSAAGRQPRVEGAVHARHVAAGALDFVSVEGAIEWENGTLSSPGLSLHRRDGGVYAVSGHVLDTLTTPRLALDVEVQDESVGALLALSDWRLPLLAHSEPIRAWATVRGTPAVPEALIRVESDAVYVVGRPAPLAMDLRWRDGRVEVESGFLRQGNIDATGT